MRSLMNSRDKMPVKIFVGNLNETSESSELQVLFEKFGQVTECDIIKNFGFVHMKDLGAAEAAIKELQGFNFNGFNMNVELSTKGTQGRSREREAGGGRGGGGGGGRGGRGGFRGGRGGRGGGGGYEGGGRGGRGGGGGRSRYDPYARDGEDRDPYRRPPPRDPYDRAPDPYDRDPYARDPYARERDPYARERDPYARDPYARDPYARDPYARDPYARDPYARDPYARDPYARDPYPPPRDRERDPYGRPPPEYYDRRGAAPPDPYERRTAAPLPAEEGAGDSELVRYPDPRDRRAAEPAAATTRSRVPQGWDAPESQTTAGQGAYSNFAAGGSQTLDLYATGGGGVGGMRPTNGSSAPRYQTSAERPGLGASGNQWA